MIINQRVSFLHSDLYDDAFARFVRQAAEPRNVAVFREVDREHALVQNDPAQLGIEGKHLNVPFGIVLRAGFQSFNRSIALLLGSSHHHLNVNIVSVCFKLWVGAVARLELDYISKEPVILKRIAAGREISFYALADKIESISEKRMAAEAVRCIAY